jgi:hypothetical protein
MALLLILLLMILSPSANATVATSSEMQQVCENWLTQKVYQQGSWAGEANPQVIGSHDIYAGDTLVAKWYDISPRGFVLVPILKEMQPIKAYSDEYNLDYDQEGGFLSLIRDMLSQRASLYASKTGGLDQPQSLTTEPVFGEGQRAEWDRLSVNNKVFRNSLPTSQSAMSSAGPLLTTSWHQRAPYNNLCPIGFEGNRTVVGCVATAAAQIMNYWQWPESGYSSHTYTWMGDQSCDYDTPGQEVTADFSDSYDWANMADSCDEGCTAAEEDALAELCYEVGVALDMNYGACGSGASTAWVATILPAYFKFSTDATINNRINFDLPSWFNLIKNEIDVGRVCDYRINSHSIVADGYRDDYGKYEYHMNYGWGGSFTTWFVLDSLYCYWQPDSLCPADQEFVITNIHPETLPALSFARIALDDPSGNNNGVAAPGENIELTPTIRNMGITAENVTAQLATSDPYVSITNSTATLSAALPWGGEAAPATPLTFAVDLSCPDPHIVMFHLTMTADGDYSKVDSFQVFVGSVAGFADDVETGEGNWMHYTPNGSYADQWHIDTYRQYGGTSSWKAGGIGEEYYADHSDACLVTPPLLLPNDAALTFWHWIAAEKDLEYGWAYDAGTVYLSTEPADWTIISPVGGYPDTMYQGSEPVPCFSAWHDWSRAEFDLSTYSGVVQIMFRFRSDAYVTDEGWYVDDISVTSTGCCGAYTGGFTGNTDCDTGGNMSLSDVTKLIDRIYLSKTALCCDENGNVDGDTEGKLALGDITKLIDHIYLSKQQTASCQ